MRIHEAASKGDVHMIGCLMDRKMWALSRDEAGNTPLQKAMLGQHRDVVEYLVTKFPKSIEARDRVIIINSFSVA